MKLDNWNSLTTTVAPQQWSSEKSHVSQSPVLCHTWRLDFIYSYSNSRFCLALLLLLTTKVSGQAIATKTITIAVFIKDRVSCLPAHFPNKT